MTHVRQPADSASEASTLPVKTAPILPRNAPARGAAALAARYVVLEELGCGGMGRVLRAYDPKLQREVAIKEVRRDALDAEMCLRLIAEARAMAQLSHPNVVAVYDVEEIESGEVVLVMEYVRGTTLRTWLRKGDRAWQEIVTRFVHAGRGLLAAHRAGLLHRDFKPANVMVAAEPGHTGGPEGGLDPQGYAKVMDFGLAKGVGPGHSPRLGSSADPDDSLTQAGTVIGTPRYMAPEQHAGEMLTPAVDQYAFCVALWEALCGEPPFTGPDVVASKLDGPPKWPRASVPRPIIDAICRGLAPEPSMRWSSMEELLAALTRDPARRRTRWAAVAGVVACLGLIGHSYVTWASARSKRCSGAEQALAGVWDPARIDEIRASMLGVDRSYALAVWERTQQALDVYAQAWISMHRDVCEATTVRQEQSTEVMDLRMGCLHRAKVELTAVTDVLAQSDVEVVSHAHDLIDTLPPLQGCADVDALRAGVEPPRAADAEPVARASELLARARAERETGRYDQAAVALSEASSLLEDCTYRPVQIELAYEQGLLLEKRGLFDEAEAALERALAVSTHQRDADKMSKAASMLMLVVGYRERRFDEALERYRPLAVGLSGEDSVAHADALDHLGLVLQAQGEFSLAESHHRDALDLRIRTLGPEHPSVATSHDYLGMAAFEQGRYEEAETAHRTALEVATKALGSEHPEVIAVLPNLANALFGQGRYDEAEAEVRDAVARLAQALGPGHPDVAITQNNLAVILATRGELAEAAAVQRHVIETLEGRLGPRHSEVIKGRANLAQLLARMGNYDEAEQEHRVALALQVELLGPRHPEVAASHNNLALTLRHLGRLAEAVQEYELALHAWEQSLGPKHPNVATASSNLALTLREKGDLAAAELHQRRALELRERAVDPESPELSAPRYHLARLLLERDVDLDEARALAELVWNARRDADVDAGARADTAFLLAQLLHRTAKTATDANRARALAKTAIDLYDSAGPGHRGATRTAQTWLASTRG